MKICPVGAELFHAGGRTDIHDEANSRLSQFCEGAEKKQIKIMSLQIIILISRRPLTEHTHIIPFYCYSNMAFGKLLVAQ
jgi:hypothetical protein